MARDTRRTFLKQGGLGMAGAALAAAGTPSQAFGANERVLLGVIGCGTKMFFDDDQQFPDTQYVAYEYPADDACRHKRLLVYEQRDWSPYVQEGHENGNAFYGTQGMMIVGDEAANALVRREYRPGHWAVPKGVGKE